MDALARTSDGLLVFFCPGCRELHAVWTITPNPQTGAIWTWNGSMSKPTFSPSILVHEISAANGHVTRPRCHSYVTDGKIAFLADCGHALADQAVLLPLDPLSQ